MSETPEFKAVETTNRGKTTIYWGSMPFTAKAQEAQGKQIVLNGRIRTIKHAEGLVRGALIECGDYAGVSVLSDGEAQWK